MALQMRYYPQEYEEFVLPPIEDLSNSDSDSDSSSHSNDTADTEIISNSDMDDIEE
jgi:hypothetical protein